MQMWRLRCPSSLRVLLDPGRGLVSAHPHATHPQLCVWSAARRRKPAGDERGGGEGGRSSVRTYCTPACSRCSSGTAEGGLPLSTAGRVAKTPPTGFLEMAVSWKALEIQTLVVNTSTEARECHLNNIASPVLYGPMIFSMSIFLITKIIYVHHKTLKNYFLKERKEENKNHF